MARPKSSFLPATWPPKAIPRLALGYPPEAGLTALTLTPEQRAGAYVLATEPRSRLDGPPGSGKTHVAATVAHGFATHRKRVLYLSPRGPLAAWLRYSLEMFGVTVKTLHACATDVLADGRSAVPSRRQFDDPAYFQAAREAVRPGAYDLVVGDEWQTTTSAEQGFVRALVGEAQFIEVTDSSRDMRFLPPRPIDRPCEVRLEQAHRLWGRLVEQGGEAPALLAKPGTPGSIEDLVQTSLVQGPEGLQEALQRALAGFLARGFTPGDIGVVSCLGRAESRGIELLKQTGAIQASNLHGAGTAGSVACDSFAYWIGLERPAVVVIEAPLGLAKRSARLQTAVSRACEALHLIMQPDELGDLEDLFGPGRA